MGTAKMKVGDLQRESPRARVLRWLEDSIKSGSLPRGAELPTEREIARIVGVATCTAALAMDEAEARGLAVRRHPGAR
ncbi:MAG: GntR family transcriptional regulator, partial [Kiritimatiellae bacterium]|nr:GntR family transcriptional regulator [Kiritimatiellia bacterium]